MLPAPAQRPQHSSTNYQNPTSIVPDRPAPSTTRSYSPEKADNPNHADTTDALKLTSTPNHTQPPRTPHRHRCTSNLHYWASLYQRHKHQALCLDIETTGWNKPTAIIGLYKPQDGIPHVTQLIRGQNLTPHILKQHLAKAKLLITYNGIHHDIKRLKTDFPTSIPQTIPILDLYRFAQNLGIPTNLKVLENTLGIERLNPQTSHRHIAVKLWKQHTAGHPTALTKLLEYNRQDTINLYPLAESLINHLTRPTPTP